MSNIPEITQREFEIMAHSLGIHPQTAKRSKRKADKVLPADFYRNRFMAGEGHHDMPVLRSLEEKGFMEQNARGATEQYLFFYVTELGEFKFRSQFQIFINS